MNREDVVEVWVEEVLVSGIGINVVYGIVELIDIIILDWIKYF